MDRLCLCAVVCVLAVPAATEGAGEGPQPTNHLAVGVRGGVGVANALAAKYGCTNEGQVSNLLELKGVILTFTHRGALTVLHAYTHRCVKVKITLKGAG